MSYHEKQNQENNKTNKTKNFHGLLRLKILIGEKQCMWISQQWSVGSVEKAAKEWRSYFKNYIFKMHYYFTNIYLFISLLLLKCEKSG